MGAYVKNSMGLLGWLRCGQPRQSQLEVKLWFELGILAHVFEILWPRRGLKCHRALAQNL